jgi:hypothetical protein
MVESKSSASCRRLTRSTDGRYLLMCHIGGGTLGDGWGSLILSLRRLTCFPGADAVGFTSSTP